jgi:hypothetical protein
MTSKENLKGKDLRDMGIDGSLTVKLLLKKYDVRVWTGCTLFGIGPNGDVLRTW